MAKNVILLFGEWHRAFVLLLTGLPNEIGPGYRWKRSILMLLIFWIAFSPIITFYMAQPYQGKTPPAAPTIEGHGDLIFLSKKEGAKHVLVAEFILPGAPPLIFQDPYGVLNIEGMGIETSPTKVYVEGFILLDGSGLFWPTYMEDSTGHVILDKNAQLKKLTTARNPFGKTLLWMYLFSMPLLVITFYNIRNLINKKAIY